jgi:hypothetical protein
LQQQGRASSAADLEFFGIREPERLAHRIR